MLLLARIQDAVGNTERAVEIFGDVLDRDPTSVEALSSLAAFHFDYGEHEIGLRYFRRLLQRGVRSVQVWNNLGLCCLKARLYDTTYVCFREALLLCEDDAVRADVWFNLSHVAIAGGDLELALRMLVIANFLDENNVEVKNNLAVLQFRHEQAKAGSDFASRAFETAVSKFDEVTKINPFVDEARFNSCTYRTGDNHVPCVVFAAVVMWRLVSSWSLVSIHCICIVLSLLCNPMRM